MTTCGLTGGIGSGKSLVCNVFRILGVPVFYADAEAKKLYTDMEVVRSIQNIFGDGLVDDQGVKLKQLAALVFKDKRLLQQLNEIIHPRVSKEFQLWQTRQSAFPACIMESAIIFEAGLEKQFDLVIDVYAPIELCIQRVLKRDSSTIAKVRQRMGAQIDPDLKREKSDIIIINDEKCMLLPQVLEAYRKIIQFR